MANAAILCDTISKVGSNFQPFSPGNCTMKSASASMFTHVAVGKHRFPGSYWTTDISYFRDVGQKPP